MIFNKFNMHKVELKYKEKKEILLKEFGVANISVKNKIYYIKTTDSRYITYLNIDIHSDLMNTSQDDKMNYISHFYTTLINVSKESTIIKLDRKLNFDFKIKQHIKNIENLKRKITNYKKYLNSLDMNLDKDTLNKLLSDNNELILKKYLIDKKICEQDYKIINKYYGISNLIKAQQEEIQILIKKNDSNLSEKYSVLQIEEKTFDLLQELILKLKVFSNLYNITSIQENDMKYLVEKLVLDNFDAYEYSNYYESNNKYFKILTINDFEVYQKYLYLSDLYNEELEFSMHIKKRNRDKALSILSDSIEELQSRYKFDSRHKGTSQARKDYQGIEALYSDIEDDTSNTICEIEIKIKIKANTKNELKQKATILKNKYSSKLFISERINEVKKDILSFSRIKKIKSTNKKEIGLKQLAFSFPFNYCIFADSNGLIKNIDHNNLLVVDFFCQTQDRESYNGVIIGNTGGGKGVSIKTMLKEHIGDGGRCFTIDQDSEYEKIVEYFGGENINFGGINKNYINIMQVPYNDNTANPVSNHLETIIIFLENLVALSQNVKMKLKRIIKDEYESRNITDKLLYSIKDDYLIFPTLKDLLNRSDQELNKTNLEKEKEIIQEVSNILFDIIHTYDILCHKTNINIESAHLVNFVITTIKNDNKLLNAVLFLIFNYMNLEMSKNRLYTQNYITIEDKIKYLKDFCIRQEIDYNFRKLDQLTNDKDKSKLYELAENEIKHKRKKIKIFFDEAHRMFDNESSVKYIIQTVRESRKYKTGIFFATQKFADFFKNKNKDILNLYGMLVYKIFLKQPKSDILEFNDILELTNTQINRLVNAPAGIGLIKLGNKYYNFKLETTQKWIKLYDGES